MARNVKWIYKREDPTQWNKLAPILKDYTIIYITSLFCIIQFIKKSKPFNLILKVTVFMKINMVLKLKELT